MFIMMDKLDIDYVIYHKNCLDGFTSAFVAYLFFKKYGKRIKYHAESAHATSFPLDIKGKNVIVFDLAYPLKLYSKMKKIVKNIEVHDHHVTNKEKLKYDDNAFFNMKKSGAMLAWEYFFGKNKPPLLIRHIEDNDLGKWKLPQTRELITAIGIHYTLEPTQYNFRKWEWLLKMTEIKKLKKLGYYYNREKFYNIDKISKNTIFKKMGKLRVGVINNSGNSGDIANYIANKYKKKCDFALVFSYNLQYDNYICVLRSIKKNVDVSKIATKHGGGGHKMASAFIYKKHIKTLFD